ncbi:hypothetical protein FRC00_007999, partial [Tulasnella sp. 408]
MIPPSLNCKVVARSNGGIWWNGAMQRGVDEEETIPAGWKLHKKTTFLDLSIDIFLTLINWLDIRDVLSLRGPTCALPLAAASSSSLEKVTLQAIRMKEKWDGGNYETIRKFTKCIERPW